MEFPTSIVISGTLCAHSVAKLGTVFAPLMLFGDWSLHETV